MSIHIDNFDFTPTHKIARDIDINGRLPLDGDEAAAANEPQEKKASGCPQNEKVRRFLKFLRVYDFPILMVLVIFLARAYPPLGAVYLAPDITAGWVAVIHIFLLSGLGLKTSDFAKAFTRLYFNAFVQFFNFFVVSFTVWAFTRFVLAVNILAPALADGLVICSCLTMSINVVIVLTVAIGGDEAAAVFNSAFGNIVGIFLTPALILMYLGTSGTLPLGEVIYKLTLRVIVPFIIGQMIQNTWSQGYDFFCKHKRWFTKSQELALLFIIYAVFCATFYNGIGVGIGNVFLVILYEIILGAFLMILAWYSLKLLFRDEPELQVMGLFGCIQKTIAMGIPLITSIFQGSPDLALYTLPILIWHSIHLVIGSCMVPRLKRFVETERKRLDEAARMASEGAGEDIEAPEAADGDNVEVSLSETSEKLHDTFADSSSTASAADDDEK